MFNPEAFEPTAFLVEWPDEGSWWFCPPSQERTPWRDPAWSRRYHHLYHTIWRGQPVTVAGRTYDGGRWYQLSEEERVALLEAGYGSRIVQARSLLDLPALDP